MFIGQLILTQLIIFSWIFFPRAKILFSFIIILGNSGDCIIIWWYAKRSDHTLFHFFGIMPGNSDSAVYLDNVVYIRNLHLISPAAEKEMGKPERSIWLTVSLLLFLAGRNLNGRMDFVSFSTFHSWKFWLFSFACCSPSPTNTLDPLQ